MAGLAEARVQRVMQAFVSRNPEQLAEVIAGDARIDALQIEIDDRCFRLIALHHPVAVDLRTIVSVLKINTDLERVGDLAVNIGEAGERYLRHPPVKPLIDLPRMGELALTMLRESIGALINTEASLQCRPPRPAELASKVCRNVMSLLYLRYRERTRCVVHTIGGPFHAPIPYRRRRCDHLFRASGAGDARRGESAQG